MTLAMNLLQILLLVLLAPLVSDGLGRRGAAWAALFTAVSPALVYYSRDYIHETLLVFFTFLSLAAGWRYWRARRLGWALLAGAGLGFMAATKETFVLSLAAAALALGLNLIWNRFVDASSEPAKAPRLDAWHLVAALAAALLVWAILFSSFFTNPAGLLDSIRTYQPWLSRAGGESPHNHPWHFYFHRLLWFHSGKGPVWTELLILALALIAAPTGFARKNLGRGNAGFVRFLALYTFLLAGFFSLISYKTPWCLLSFWHGAVLLAGVGAAVSLRSLRPRPVRLMAAFLIAAGAVHLAWQAWQGGAAYAADRRNPWVYAQTSPDVLDVAAQIESLAAADPQGHNLIVKVMAAENDYWPLPWYLRGFRRVGWWGKLPDDPYAPLMIVSATFRANLDEKQTHLMPRYFELRPQVLMELYVERELWQEWLAHRQQKQ